MRTQSRGALPRRLAAQARGQGEPPPVGLIVAQGLDGSIGYRGALPWHVPNDLRAFRALTRGCVLVMGHRTAATDGQRLASHGRTIVQVGRRPKGGGPDTTLAKAVHEARRIAEKVVWVAGGAQTYLRALEAGVVEFLDVTTVHVTPSQADVWLPLLPDGPGWQQAGEWADGNAEATRTTARQYVRQGWTGTLKP